MIEHNPEFAEKVVLVGVAIRTQKPYELEEYLDELEFLALTAGGLTVGRFIQHLQHPDKRYFIGSGKVNEIKIYNKLHDVDTVIFDEELSPSQQRNLEETLKCKILDRTSLILDIFAQRAQTKQASTQVELAQMQYLLPRLKGLWTHLERQKGGIGMRGPGEKEIETDRRIVQDKISNLKKDLIKLNKQNVTQRKNRGELIRVALVGYTNVGKSTIMNLLSKSDVMAENKLFATLDTTVRKVVLDRIPFLLSDTVGFIRKLPHSLVESFKTTLDEAKESDILAHVVDASHPNFREHIEVVNQTLIDLGAIDIPVLMIFNKMDIYMEDHFDSFLPDDVKEDLLNNFKSSLEKSFPQHKCVFISATKKQNIDILRDTVALMVQHLYYKRYPYKNIGY